MFNVPEKTKAEKITDIVREIDKTSYETIENAKVGYKAAYDLLWHNSEITPQEICDAFGNEAYKLFENAMKWISLIQEFDATWVYPPAPNLFTINQDGTVTIGEPIEIEEEITE